MSVVSIQHVLIHCILLLFLSFENLLIEYLDCSQCARWCVVHWIYGLCNMYEYPPSYSVGGYTVYTIKVTFTNYKLDYISLFC